MTKRREHHVREHVRVRNGIHMVVSEHTRGVSDDMKQTDAADAADGDDREIVSSLEERAAAIGRREAALRRTADALAARESWLNERETQLNHRDELMLKREKNFLVEQHLLNLGLRAIREDLQKCAEATKKALLEQGA